MKPADLAGTIGKNLAQSRQSVITHAATVTPALDPVTVLGAAISVKPDEVDDDYVVHVALNRTSGAQVRASHRPIDTPTTNLYLEALGVLIELEPEPGSIVIRLVGSGAADFVTATGGTVPGTRMLLKTLNVSSYKSKVRRHLGTHQHKHAFHPHFDTYLDPDSPEFEARHGTGYDTTAISDDSFDWTTDPWAVVAVKSNRATKNFDAFTLIHHQGWTSAEVHHTGVPALNERVQDAYHLGLEELEAFHATVPLTRVHMVGPGIHAYTEHHDNTDPVLGAPIARFPTRFYDQVITTLDTGDIPVEHFNPIHLAVGATNVEAEQPPKEEPVTTPKSVTRLRVYSDASQILGHAREAGYGHGSLISTADGTPLEASSTWVNTDGHLLRSNQFELDGALLTLGRVAEMHPPTGDRQVRITVYCDNTATVATLNRLYEDTSGLNRPAVLAKVLGNALNMERYPWLFRTDLMVTAEWVRGHNGHTENSLVDKLAGLARKHHYGSTSGLIYDAAVHKAAYDYGVGNIVVDPYIGSEGAEVSVA